MNNIRTNCFILDEHEIGLMLGTRCASTSIKQSVLVSAGANNGTIHKNEYLLARQVPKEEMQICPYRVFATVRNPYDRLFSTWQHCVRTRFWERFHYYGISPHDSYEEFVQKVVDIPAEDTDIHLVPLSVAFSVDGGLIPDVILRQEGLLATWQEVRNESVLALPKLDTLNRTSDGTFSDNSGLRLPEIATYYKQDFEVFGYSQ